MLTLFRGEPARRSESEIVAHLRVGGSALVALSGGVDSAVVAGLARQALGPEAVAVTLTGPAVAEREVGRARAVARKVGIDHVVLDVDPLSRSEYRENRPDRCYFCRSVESERLRRFGAERSVRQLLDGVHLDDLSEERPGLRAMNEAGFSHPLVWAGWTKADVRRAARARDLPNAEQPSDACLASRIAHGDPITAELLHRVEAAESVLLGRGFRRVRVRVRGSSARIEVDPAEVAQLLREPVATEVEQAVRGLGFDPVSIDPAGYHGVAVPRGGRP
jgi:pyridinium-3,5-biscarboxylic acid mononucleotide sulfurtransferase